MLRILIVEDENEKLRLVCGAILESPEMTEDCLTVVSDVHNAKLALKKTRFDMVILDINLPKRLGQSNSVGAGIDVLNFLRNNSSAIAPACLMGLTAYEDGIVAASQEFLSPLWKLVYFSYSDDVWKRQIQLAIEYLLGQQQPPYVNDGNSHHIDVAIFVALEDEELEAVLALECNWKAVNVKYDPTEYYLGKIVSVKGEASLVIAAAPRMGMPAAAVIASKLISTFRPRFLISAGICAGVRGKANIGDVLVADPCFDWGSGKWVNDAEQGKVYFRPAAYQWRLDETVRAGIKKVSKTPNLMNEIYAKFTGNKPECLPKILIDAVASGASVLQASSFVKEIQQNHKNLIGIEMESYAVITAAEYASDPRPVCMSIKSVCDFGDEQKEDGYHAYAAYVSAEFIYAFLSGWLLDEIS